eukprot:gene9718-11934_t
MSSELIYFNGRGLGEITRLLLSYADVQYTDTRVESITEVKNRDELPFGQIPFFKDAEHPEGIAQSGVINRYLARKYKLNGNGESEQLKVEQFYDSVFDFINNYAIPRNDPAKFEYYKNTKVPNILKAYERSIVKNGGKFLFGNHVTLADFAVYHAFEHLAFIGFPELTKGYPIIEKFRSDLEASKESFTKYIKSRPTTYQY